MDSDHGSFGYPPQGGQEALSARDLKNILDKGYSGKLQDVRIASENRKPPKRLIVSFKQKLIETVERMYRQDDYDPEVLGRMLALIEIENKNEKE